MVQTNVELLNQLLINYKHSLTGSCKEWQAKMFMRRMARLKRYDKITSAEVIEKIK